MSDEDQEDDEKKIVDESERSSRLNETIQLLATKVYAKKSILKSELRELAHVGGKTFNDAIEFLKNLRMITESYYPPVSDKESKHKGQRSIVIRWRGWAHPDIVGDLTNLATFGNLDLTKYPIRGLDNIDDEKKLLVKKFIFRCTHIEGEITKMKHDKIFSFLYTDIPSNIKEMVNVKIAPFKDIYIFVRDGMAAGKVEIGLVRDNIVIYKNPDWVAKVRRWICKECGMYNPSTNKFCGGCGEPKEKVVIK